MPSTVTQFKFIKGTPDTFLAIGSNGRGEAKTAAEMRPLLGLGSTDTPTFAVVTSGSFAAAGAGQTTIGNATGGVAALGDLDFNGTLETTSNNIRIGRNLSSAGTGLFINVGAYPRANGINCVAIGSDCSATGYHTSAFGVGMNNLVSASTLIGSSNGKRVHIRDDQTVTTSPALAWGGEDSQRVNGDGWESYNTSWQSGYRQSATPSSVNCGFFGVTPVSRPQVSTSTGTLSDVLTALNLLGLIETVA